NGYISDISMAIEPSGEWMTVERPAIQRPLTKKRRRPKPTPGGSWKLGLTLAVVAIEFERAAPACYPRFKSVPFCDAGEELVALSCNPREAVRDGLEAV